MIFDSSEHSVIFLSYDEPNCEENYKHLTSMRPDAIRVHGIKGSDTAHKLCGTLSKTPRCIIVDGDNYVLPGTLSSIYELEYSDTSTISFSGKNTVNGMQYGNGGIKSWPVSILQSMRTHENTNSESTLTDFDMSRYVQLNVIGSEVRINGSRKQAWRAGFREGVKLMLDNVKYERDIHNIDWRNYNRLWNWMHIGADVENGIWAIHGARFGCLNAINKFELSNLHDFEYLDYLFDTVSNVNVLDDAENLKEQILSITNDSRISNVYSPEKSKEYKSNVKPVLRSPNDNPYDMVFISFNEPFADENYSKLKTKFPGLKRVDGVVGIHNAHIQAATICETDYFWVIDADAEIVDDFKFDYRVPFYDKLKVRVWRAKNPVNDLVYGYGGVKLLPRIATIHMRKDKPDMTTSICDLYEPIMVVSNTTKFNTDPFNTWRSAFRECAKLASQVIDTSKETMERLNVWCTIGEDREYGNYAIEGAIEGRAYGLKHKGDLVALSNINNFDWMKEQYDRLY